jgi:hypothetical protein
MDDLAYVDNYITLHYIFRTFCQSISVRLTLDMKHVTKFNSMIVNNQ